MREYIQGTDRVTEHCLIATAFGPVGLAWSEQGLVRLQLPDADGGATLVRLTKGLADSAERHPPEWLEPHVVALQGYFAGKRTGLSEVPVDLSAVPDFHRTVYAETIRLGWGEIITYGELAERIGSPGAAQSVGQAMGKNPMPIVIPCHRVLASGNKLGGFSAPGGVRSKLRLLEMEGVMLGARNPAQMAFAF